MHQAIRKQLLFFSLLIVGYEKRFENMSYICFDVGGTAIKHALITKDGIILKQNQFPTNHGGKDEFIDSLIIVIKEYEKEDVIEGIGLSFPGVVDPDSGISVSAGALYSLYEENIKKELHEQTNYLVTIENDANCALLAEKFNGKATTDKDVLLVTIGTGIGGALMVQDHVIHGHQFKAGEFGMMRIDFGQQPHTTLHELASTSALVRFYKEAKSISLETVIDAREIFVEMDKDPIVTRVVNRWIDYLVTGIFNMVVFMNPEKVLIGGGISSNPKLIPLIRTALAKNPHWIDFEVPIDSCQHQNNAGILGALYCLLEEKKKIEETKLFLKSSV